MTCPHRCFRAQLCALLAACALLAGCGQKGPLFHPTEPPPAVENSPAPTEPATSDSSSTTNSDAASER